jgi:cytosine/adenosine deaminase-related metal-dependent hydrolase
VPHASYSVSKELFCLINECSANKIISIHNQESEDENLFIKHKQGDFLRLYKQLGIDISFFNSTQKSSLQYYINSLQNAAKTILVHNTFTQKEDVALINILSKTNKTQFFLCLCVITNEYINNCFPNFKVLFSNNQNIVIGTDSLASNHSLNILTEIQTIHHLYNEIGINELLQFATFNGATALGIENEFGSFKKDTKPGVLLIENFISSKKPITLV